VGCWRQCGRRRDAVWAAQSEGVSGGTVAGCARRLCGTWAALCTAETRAWTLGVMCEGAAGVEKHVQRSGGAVIVPYWQRSGSAEASMQVHAEAAKMQRRCGGVAAQWQRRCSADAAQWQRSGRTGTAQWPHRGRAVAAQGHFSVAYEWRRVHLRRQLRLALYRVLVRFREAVKGRQ
jgi:hypothetical protein